MSYCVDEGKEEWRPVVGYEGIYEVSNLARVRRVIAWRAYPAGMIMGTPPKPNGYLAVSLSREGSTRINYLHRVVAKAFLGPIPPGYEVNHIDGDKANPLPANLEYLTRSENNLHAAKMGLSRTGSRHPAAKLTEEQIADLRSRRGTATHQELAAMFGITQSTVTRILNGKRWRHVA